MSPAIQGPDRARIDLFGPRGESYLAAALVGDDLRIPAGVDPDVVPPKTLLWSALGVVRPPDDARLVSTERGSSGLSLRYRSAEGTWTFVLSDGTLRSARLDPASGSRQTVELDPAANGGVPQKADYRDWVAFRELVLTLENVTDVNAFPADIWSPDSR